jgi:hypothetical protein
MIRNPHKIRPYRHRTRSLIATRRIKPEILYISEVEAKTTLRASGYGVKQIKKIRLLRHQVCISYWNEQGGVCSGFFSYRLFSCWEKAVEELIDGCSTLKAWQVLNWVMRSELTYYPYPVEISMSLSLSLQRRLSELQTPIITQEEIKGLPSFKISHI